MKTSNKLLSGAYIFLAIVTIGFLMTVKSNMVKSEPQILKGNGIIKIENLGELKSNKMILSTKYNYKFDHSSSDIILEGDENIVTELKACISNGRISMFNVLYSCGVLENYQDVEFMIPMETLTSANLKRFTAK